MVLHALYEENAALQRKVERISEERDVAQSKVERGLIRNWQLKLFLYFHYCFLTWKNTDCLGIYKRVNFWGFSKTWARDAEWIRGESIHTHLKATGKWEDCAVARTMYTRIWWRDRNRYKISWCNKKKIREREREKKVEEKDSYY